MTDRTIADFLFEARFLKQIPRSGFAFLGAGKESVAEHSFLTSIIGWILASMRSDIDSEKLVCLCLLHDLAEARTGDLNSVQKIYDHADEGAAVRDMIRNMPFSRHLGALMEEFRHGMDPEAVLARDADQLSMLLELKYLWDKGHPPAQEWIPFVLERIQTREGRILAESILETKVDSWWMNKFIDSKL